MSGQEEQLIELLLTLKVGADDYALASALT